MKGEAKRLSSKDIELSSEENKCETADAYFPYKFLKVSILHIKHVQSCSTIVQWQPFAIELVHIFDTRHQLRTTGAETHIGGN